MQLVDIFAAVHKMRPNSRLWLVGGGELDDSLKNQVKSKVHELGLDESVVILLVCAPM